MTVRVFFRWVAWLLVLAIAAFGVRYPKHRLHILVLLVGLVGLLEVAQNFLPSRHGRLPDEIVKTSGAFLGVALAMFIERRKRVHKKEFCESRRLHSCALRVLTQYFIQDDIRGYSQE
jgi:VanZ family protein